MKRLISLSLIFFSFVFRMECYSQSEHPRIYISENKREAFNRKIQTVDWSKELYDSIKSQVTVYVDRHRTNPQWIISRMQMYWDTHYERVYVKGNFFSHGTGRAPVPTVKFAGARDWETDYVMPSLEETQPYMDSKGMYLQNMKKEGHPWEWVHPSQTGRIIGPMNDRILELAANAAMIYWTTKEEKYAVFAKDILMTYIQGMYYRREPFALENYSNSHLMGLANFEVILDHVIPGIAVCYDFLYDYLKKEGTDLSMIQTVIKRFADQEIMYGVPDNNWNIFQARFVSYLALALEDDAQYKDGKGRQYYLNEIFNHTTIRQFALKETLEIFGPTTAIWPESASYSMAVCKDFLDIVCLVDNAENNHLLDTFAILKQAVPATVQYLFPNGRATAFGDSKYTPLRPQPFEMLIALYRKYGNTEQEKKLTGVLQKMITDGFYKRSEEKNMFALFFYVDQLKPLNPGEITYNQLITPTFYTPGTSWLIQRNGTDPQNGMAYTLVGANGNHAHANGISLEWFGKGWVLGPESSFGVSYGSRDNQEYYSRFPAHNTVVVDGKSDYGMMRSNNPYQLLSCYPASADTASLTGDVVFSRVAFTEPATDARQERLTGIIRTGTASAYLIDIFRSKRNDGKDKKHEYFYHNIGQSLTLSDGARQNLNLSPTTELSSTQGDIKGYDYFENKKSVAFDGDFNARFQVGVDGTRDVSVNLWMKGYPGRTLFSVLAPKSNALTTGSTPKNLVGSPLPTLGVRQNGEAWKRPFVAVYEPYQTGEGSSIESIRSFGNDENLTGIVVTSKSGRKDYIFNASGSSSEFTSGDMKFKGQYAIISESKGELHSLFLGDGQWIEKGKWALQTQEPGAQASLIKSGKNYRLRCTGKITLKTPAKKIQLSPISKKNEKVNPVPDPDGSSTFSVPAGEYILF